MTAHSTDVYLRDGITQGIMALSLWKRMARLVTTVGITRRYNMHVSLSQAKDPSSETSSYLRQAKEKALWKNHLSQTAGI